LAASCAAIAAAAATPALADAPVGPPKHVKGPRVFLDYDQVELDAAYDQSAYEPNMGQIMKRMAARSEAVRRRIGAPRRIVYGPTPIEQLDVYRTSRSGAPTFVFIHGGAWRAGRAQNQSFPAEMITAAGAHFVVPDFVWVQDAGGNLNVMADQVRRAVAWTVKNASSFGGDPKRVYVGGHSSGGHLAGVVLTTDWSAYGLADDAIRGGLCMSGMYDLYPVSLTAYSKYVKFDGATIAALSPQRHIERLHAPLIVAYGTSETPEFQRQNRDFAAAVKAAGKRVELVVGPYYSHLEVEEALGNPYAFTGRAALRLMGLAPTA
jgi:arylformamidase